MKIVITGHTKGLGKVLFDHFVELGHDVKGASRTNGYYLPEDINHVKELAKDCDLFIANATAGQLYLLQELHDKVGMFIAMGSIAGDYHQLIQSDYSTKKMDLAKRCKELSLVPGNKILHLNISMLEDAESSDNLISFQEVVDTIDFWIKHPRINKIDFEFKLTAFTLEQVKNKFNASQEAIDHVVANMCDTNRSAFNS
jgi:hypothetical protein